MIIKNGHATIENYWGEKLKYITVFHSFKGLKDTTATFFNPGHGESEKDSLTFYYYTGVFSPQNYWGIRIRTMDDHMYSLMDTFYCSITESDHGKAIIGVNGVSQTVYINFPSSSGCSKKLIRIE